MPEEEFTGSGIIIGVVKLPWFNLSTCASVADIQFAIYVFYYSCLPNVMVGLGPHLPALLSIVCCAFAPCVNNESYFLFDMLFLWVTSTSFDPSSISVLALPDLYSLVSAWASLLCVLRVETLCCSSLPLEAIYLLCRYLLEIA